MNSDVIMYQFQSQRFFLMIWRLPYQFTIVRIDRQSFFILNRRAVAAEWMKKRLKDIERRKQSILFSFLIYSHSYPIFIFEEFIFCLSFTPSFSSTSIYFHSYAITSSKTRFCNIVHIFNSSLFVFQFCSLLTAFWFWDYGCTIVTQ